MGRTAATDPADTLVRWRVLISRIEKLAKSTLCVKLALLLLYPE